MLLNDAHVDAVRLEVVVAPLYLYLELVCWSFILVPTIRTQSGAYATPDHTTFPPVQHYLI